MEEKLKIKYFVIPLVMTLIMFVQVLLQEVYRIDFQFAALHPKHADGLKGIILSIFVHGSWKHFFSNLIPFFLFSVALFQFYTFAFKLLIYITILTGLNVWLMADSNTFHVGVSGVIYGLASFHITSAILRREMRIMAFAMLIIFLYGSMIWGFFPEFFPNENISWESHLMGFVVGIIFAFYYRDEGPKRPEIIDEDEDEYGDEIPYWKKSESEIKEKESV